MDTCAAITMMRRADCSDYPVLATPSSRRGVWFRAANNGKIQDEGSRILCVGGNDCLRQLRTKVGSISRNLLAAQDLLDMGHAIWLDNDGSYMVHKATGLKTNIVHRNRIFEMDLEVVPFAESPFAGPAMQ